MALLNNVSKKMQQTTNADGILGFIFLLAFRVKAYLCCFTQFTVDQSKLTVNGSVLSDTPNVRYLVALYFLDDLSRECSGSVVEYLTRDRRAVGTSLTGVTALLSLSKTHLS